MTRQGPWIIFLSQVHPLFPTSLLNYLYGLTRVPVRTCVLWIALGQIPGMFLYAFLGRSLAAREAAPLYNEWIRTYADPNFEALAVRLEALLDRHATDSAPVRANYRRAMELEYGFFDANC